jgi:2-haloacid dehalogenase
VIDLERIQLATFDCYGTLIDWESGILTALAPFRKRYGLRETDDEILAQYAALEAVMESGEYLSYKDVLRGVMRGFSQRASVPESEFDLDLLVDSLPEWPAFPDTVDALKRLQEHFGLGIISNTDDDLFADTAQTLEIEFDFVVTAEQVRSYKPDINNFRRAMEVFGIEKESWLHVAQSRYHDVAPARSLGVSTVWINRRAGKNGDGATAASTARADAEFPTLGAFADWVDAAQ